MARLLIVEDHSELASLMVAAAQSRGHEATAVHTGEAALALVRPGAFAAAVVDLLLPDMRGSVVLSALRAQDIPAIAVSGVFKGDRFAREATEVHGARAFFEKPFELIHLLACVEQLCGLDGPAPEASLGGGDDEADEVVVFDDAALMEIEDEPGFAVTEEDEPLFAAPEAAPPVVQGSTLIEEAQDPLNDAPPPAAPPAPAEPSPSLMESPAFVRETPITLRTVELAGLVDLSSLDTGDLPTVPPAPAGPVSPAASFESLGSFDADDAPPATAAVSDEELEALEALAPAAEPPVAPAPPADDTPPATSVVSDEELQALEALAPAESPATEPPVAEPPADEPPADEPPVAEPPADEPPADEPPPEAAEAAPEAEAALAEDPSPSVPDPAEPEPGLALPFGEREKVWSKTASDAPRPRAPPAWSLAGDLKDTSVPRLLNAYYEARHSGELKLRQGTLQKVIYFEAGRPVYAASNLAAERFLNFCVRRGVVPEARAREALALAKEQNLRSSEALARLGLVNAARRKQVLEELVKEVLWSTFAWTEGAYGFSALKPPSAGRVPLAVFPGNLILEGIQRAEPLVLLRQNMPRTRRLFPSPAPAYGLHELKLKNQQALLLAYADGSKTVEDLLTLSDLPEREGLATLRGLELLGVLEERREEPGNRRRISFGL